MQEVVEYDRLLPYQFRARMLQAPLAYVPMGSLEWHGEHMAIGNDSIKMHGLMVEAARIGGGIVFPPIFFGIPGMTDFQPPHEFNGNMPYEEPLIRALLVRTLEGLQRVGFKAAILATGHTCGEQRQLMRDVVSDYTGTMRVVGTDDASFGDAMGHFSDHAAKWETSILWYLHPELVDIHRLEHDTSIPNAGVFGDDPRLHASRELGEQVVAQIAREIAELGRSLLQ